MFLYFIFSQIRRCQGKSASIMQRRFRSAQSDRQRGFRRGRCRPNEDRWEGRKSFIKLENQFPIVLVAALRFHSYIWSVAYLTNVDLLIF